MGHLINPVSLRLGVSRYWNSKWVASNSKYKYQFLFKSDWNIYNFLIRFFMKKVCIKAGFVFSHALFVRKPNCLYCLIYFWNGKSFNTLKSDFRKFFYYNKRHKLLYKFFVIFNFFLLKEKSLFFLDNFFKKFKGDLISFFFFFKIFYVKIYSSVLNLIFKIYLNSRLDKKKKLILIIFLSFIFLRKQKFNSIIFMFRKLFKLLFIRKIFLIKLEKLFCKFKNNFFFFKSIFFNNYNHLINGNSSIFIIAKIIKRFLYNYSSGYLKNYNLKLLMRPMDRLDINSNFLGRYLAIRLRQRYRLAQALNPVFSDLRQNPVIEGYRVNCSGRFTKKEIASYEWFRFGSVPLNTLKATVDFAMVPFILKYSLCSFKVWLHLKKDKLKGKGVFKYLYRDFIIHSLVKKENSKL